MRRGEFLGGILVMVLVTLFLAGCVEVGFLLYGDGPNTDPRQGSVEVGGYNESYQGTKRCDGTTLVYTYRRGISTVPNSPECMR